jgi:ABC-2 type transport system permease protein
VTQPTTRLPGGLAPQPGAASRAKVIATQTAFEVKTTLRNGEQLVLTIAIPLIVLLAMSHAPASIVGGSPVINIVTPGVFGLAVMSTAFTGLAIATAFERRYGVLRFLGSTPLGRVGFLTAKTLSVLVIEIVQIALLAIVAFATGWQPTGSWAYAVIVLLVGTASFAALGLLLAGTLRAEGTLAVANLIYLVLLGLGGVIVPANRFPQGISHVISLLPSSALGDGLRSSLIHGVFPAADLTILLGWFLIGLFGVTRWFRWS